MSIAYLNGVFGALDELSISPLDRGFVFGDGVYEVIPVYKGAVFRAGQHVARLGRSLREVCMENPHDVDEWQALIHELATRNGGGDQLIYLQVTRGAAPRLHAFPADLAPTIFAMASARVDSIESRPVSAITGADNRWSRCDIKSISLLPNVLWRQRAVAGGCAECILIRDGMLTEGAASNVFVVTGDGVATPPPGPHLLRGVTRDLIIELCAEAGSPVVEREITEGEMRSAREILLTSSSLEIAPVVKLDGSVVGDGRPGLAWRHASDLFRSYKARTLEAGA